MSKCNFDAVRERHLAAVRWEKCRACWFERNGERDRAKASRLLMKDHLRAASNAFMNAAMEPKKNQASH